MTKAGKCETCRRRKIKCDESRPTCSGCSSRGRPCVYAQAPGDVFIHEPVAALVAISRNNSTDTSREVTPCRKDSGFTTTTGVPISFQLKRRKGAQTGNGQFFTFKPCRSRKDRNDYARAKEVSAQKQCPEKAGPSRLSTKMSKNLQMTTQEVLFSRLVATMGISALDVSPFGDWIKYIGPLSNAAKHVELAVDYAMSSMVLFRSRTEANLATTCRAGKRALRSLIEHTASCNSSDGSVGLLNAVIFHCAAEQFIGMAECHYAPHISAAAGIAASCYTRGSTDPSVRSIASSVCEDEFIEAILWGRCSNLESVAAPIVLNGSSVDLDTAHDAVEYLLHQLPRLLLVVRSAAQSPDATSTTEEAISMVLRLYHSSLDIYVGRACAELSRNVCPSSDPMVPPCAESVLGFPSVPAFALMLRYSHYRVMICGLVQTLYKLETANVPVNRTQVEMEDVAAAKAIAMCADYALRSDSPLVTLKVLGPLQLGFAGWHRLQKRQPPENTLEYQQAVQMKAWHVRTARIVDEMWLNTPSNPWRLERISEMCAGGSMETWMHDYRQPGFIGSRPGDEYE